MLTNEEKEENNVVFPFIEGERVDLVTQNSKWINLYCKWQNDPEVRRYARTALPETLEDVKKWFEPAPGRGVRNNIFLNIYHKRDKCPIGVIALVGISWLDRIAFIYARIGEPKYWGKGLVVEAAKLIIKYGFNELNLHKINARVYNPNKRSLRAAEKLGFKNVGILKNNLYIDGEYVDEHWFSIFQKDWKEQNRNISK
jgi:RimJ/RimL family protein N-acetyltransferase